jgi:hypothetical protein
MKVKNTMMQQQASPRGRSRSRHAHRLPVWTRQSLAAAFGAAVIVAASATGCAANTSPGPGAVATSPLQVMIAATNPDDCLNFPLAGHRPQCSVTSWLNNTACYVTGLFPHTPASGLSCLCYEGQTRSCTADGTLPQWCDEYDGQACGVQSCTITGTGALASGTWETTCHPAPPL